MLRGILYWMAVLAVSVVFVILLILYFESRDRSSLEGGVLTPVPVQPLF